MHKVSWLYNFIFRTGRFSKCRIVDAKIAHRVSNSTLRIYPYLLNLSGKSFTIPNSCGHLRKFTQKIRSSTFCRDRARIFFRWNVDRTGDKANSSFSPATAASLVAWYLFTHVQAHVGIGDYVSRLRARPELESAGLHDKTWLAEGRLSRERKAARGFYRTSRGTADARSSASVTQAAWNCMEELEIIHRCHQANWCAPAVIAGMVAWRWSAPTWIRTNQLESPTLYKQSARDTSPIRRQVSRSRRIARVRCQHWTSTRSSCTNPSQSGLRRGEGMTEIFFSPPILKLLLSFLWESLCCINIKSRSVKKDYYTSISSK